MEETLHQPAIPAGPAPGRPFQRGPARMVFLLVLPAAGLALLVWTVLKHSPLAGTKAEAARVARDNPPGTEVAPSAGSLQEVLKHPDLIPTHDHPLLGRPAPAFTLIDSESQARNSRELLSSGPVVLIFSYGLHCNHCARQLFDVNRDLPLFREAGARVVAISADPLELTRRPFQRQGPFGFLVLSDPGNQVGQAYQVLRADFLRHGTFLIDRQGTVRWVNLGDAPFRRNSALLSHLARMEGRLQSAQAAP